MRKIKKYNYKTLLISLIVSIAGIIMLILAGILISVFSEENVPLAKAHPEMQLPYVLLINAGLLSLIYGLMYFLIILINRRGKRVTVDGTLLKNLKAFSSKYTPLNQSALYAEIKKKLLKENFSPLANVEYAYYRAGKISNDVFYFAKVKDFQSLENLTESLKKLREAASAAQTGARVAEISAGFFLALEEVTDEQLLKICEFAESLIGAEAYCNLSLYSLKENRAYVTYSSVRVPRQPFKVERGAVFLENLSSGRKHWDVSKLYAKKQSAGGPAVSVSAINPVENSGEAFKAADGIYPLDFMGAENCSPRIDNAPFTSSVVFGSLFLAGFFVALGVWLGSGIAEPLMFCCIFLPTLLLPALILGYFAVASYKKVRIGKHGITLIRPFGNVEIFNTSVYYTEKILAGSLYFPAGRRVYALYPVKQDTEEDKAAAQAAEEPVAEPAAEQESAEQKPDGAQEGKTENKPGKDIIFSANNYKSYVILKYNAYNKSLLEKFTKYRKNI